MGTWPLFEKRKEKKTNEFTLRSSSLAFEFWAIPMHYPGPIHSHLLLTSRRHMAKPKTKDSVRKARLLGEHEPAQFVVKHGRIICLSWKIILHDHEIEWRCFFLASKQLAMGSFNTTECVQSQHSADNVETSKGGRRRPFRSVCCFHKCVLQGRFLLCIQRKWCGYSKFLTCLLRVIKDLHQKSWSRRAVRRILSVWERKFRFRHDMDSLHGAASEMLSVCPVSERFCSFDFDE